MEAAMTDTPTRSDDPFSLNPELLHLGQLLSVEAQPAPAVQLKAKTLLRHVMALGSSGSGKTVLCKVLVEEMTRLGLPAICIDPQGDLCSLALALSEGELDELENLGVSPELAERFRSQVEVVVFTPASRRGIPLCADPLNIDISALELRERIEATSNIATMITSLLGYDLGSDDGEGVRAAFDSFLNMLYEQGLFPQSLERFASQLNQMSEEAQTELERFINPKKLSQALRKLARLDVGARRLLFHEGIPINVDLLLGRGAYSEPSSGKTRLSVVYLNTLNSSEDKEFLIAAIAEQLYAWMLQNPSKDPQALFYIDEVAPFIPPVKVPACKPSLSLIFKQARKYGVCCLMATQNPGDVDYKAMAQFGSWAIGRLTTRQDLKKIQPTLKSLDPDRADELIKRLPTLQAGEFMLLSPDAFDETITLKTRWLYSKHETLDDRSIERLCDERWRERFLAIEQRVSQRETPAQEGAPSVISPIHTSASHDEPSLASGERLEDEGSLEDDEPSEVELSASTELEPSLEEELLARLDEGGALSCTELSEALKIGRARVSKALKALEASERLLSFKRGRSKRYYSPLSGARPDLELDAKVAALIPKMSRDEIEERIELNRQKSLFSLFGKDEDLESKRLIYHIVYQVSFREAVKRANFGGLFGERTESVEDSIYLDPQSLKVFVYEPNKAIQIVEQPSVFASDIPDFDGVSDLTELAPRSVKFDEDAWGARQEIEAVKRSVCRRFTTLKILKVRPVMLPVWQLRYKERGGHQVRVIYIDGLTGQAVSLHG